MPDRITVKQSPPRTQRPQRGKENRGFRRWTRIQKGARASWLGGRASSRAPSLAKLAGRLELAALGPPFHPPYLRHPRLIRCAGSPAPSQLSPKRQWSSLTPFHFRLAALPDAFRYGFCQVHGCKDAAARLKKQSYFFNRKRGLFRNSQWS